VGRVHSWQERRAVVGSIRHAPGVREVNNHAGLSGGKLRGGEEGTPRPGARGSDGPYGLPNLWRYSADSMKARTISARLTRAKASASCVTSSPGRLNASSLFSQKS